MAIKLRQIRNFNELWSKAQSIYDFQPHAQNSYDQNYYNLQCLCDIIRCLMYQNRKFLRYLILPEAAFQITI